MLNREPLSLWAGRVGKSRCAVVRGCTSWAAIIRFDGAARVGAGASRRHAWRWWNQTSSLEDTVRENLTLWETPSAEADLVRRRDAVHDALSAPRLSGR